MKMYEKNNHVFWVQIDSGLLLQNVQTNYFIELNAVQGKVWEYLDGTFSEQEIAKKIYTKNNQISLSQIRTEVTATISLLKQFDLISATSPKHGNQRK